MSDSYTVGGKSFDSLGDATAHAHQTHLSSGNSVSVVGPDGSIKHSVGPFVNGSVAGASGAAEPKVTETKPSGFGGGRK